MCVECERGVWQHGGRMFKVWFHAVHAIMIVFPSSPQQTRTSQVTIACIAYIASLL